MTLTDPLTTLFCPPQASGLAALLVGLLWVSLPGTAASVSLGAGGLSTLDQGSGDGRRTTVALLAQLPTYAESLALPSEVQGWARAARTADHKGDTATALRLQRQVVAWLQANRPTNLNGFRGAALSTLSVPLNVEGQKQEAMAAMEEALKLRRELAETNEELLKIRRELEKINPNFLSNLVDSIARGGNVSSQLGRRQEALANAEEAVKIRRELVKTNPAVLPDLAKSLNQLRLLLI